MINLVVPKSPFLDRDSMMPPLGVFYLSSVLKKAGIEARVIDLALGDEIQDGPVFITGTTPQYEEMLKVKNGYTVAGGPHASIDYQRLKNEFSCVVVGEGEQVIVDIAKKSPTGVIFAPRIKRLDDLPFPDRSTAHRYHWEINGRKATTLITSRGCNGKCAFCCKAIMDKGISFRSVSDIIFELTEIKDMGFGAVMFYDDSIAMIKKRLIDLCKGIGKLDLLWRCFVRSDQVSPDLYKVMADSGCYEVLIGVESGSDTILRNIRKNETAEQHKNAIKWAKEAGIKTKVLMIAGLPGESWKTIDESRKFIIETRPDGLDVTILQVYPGCDIAKNPQNYELFFISPVWYKGRNEEYISTVSTLSLTEKEIVQARDSLWKTFINL